MPKIVSIDNCVGCTACASICPKQCIEMKKDADGFSYPEVIYQLECVECGACEHVCPLLKNELEKKELPIAYAAVSEDEVLRAESSSGGIFTEIAKRIIEQDGVVYGAAYDDQFEVKHYCIDNEEELWKLRGAKYAESDIGTSFSDILDKLKKGQFVLFSGTPCQVAGLKTFVKKDFENLFCVDFVCHGVPSPMAWKSYIEHRANKDANGELPIEINLRSKSTGWSKYQYSNVFKYENGKEHSVLSSQSLFMNLFVGDYISRPSCENCKFKGYNRVSDFTLGDFWGIWDIDPDMDDNKGTSVVLVHSEKGKDLWSEISENIRFKEVSLEKASQQNPSMLMASKAKQDRESVLKRIRDGQIESCEKLFVQPRISMMTKVKAKLRRLWKKSKLPV